MRYNIDPIRNILEIERNGKVISFTGNRYLQKNTLKKKTPDEGPLTIVNAFLGTLNDSETGILFNCLSSLFDLNENMLSLDDLQHLDSMVSEFCSHVGLDSKLEEFAKQTIKAPDTFSDEYENLQIHTRKQTYLKSDYYPLAGLTILIKLLLPYFIVFMNTTDVDNRYLEMMCVDLLPEEVKTYKAYGKLFDYAGTMIPNVNNINMDIMVNEGVNSENINYWIFSKIIMSRLTIIHLLSMNDDVNIITFIYRHSISKINPRSNTISDKDMGSDSEEDGDDGESDFQSYRCKDKHTLAEQELLIHCGSKQYLNDMAAVFLTKKQKATYNSILSSINIVGIRLTDNVMTIVKWVLQDMVEYLAYSLLDHNSLVRLLVFAHVVLQEYHPYIAAYILTSTKYDERGNYIYIKGNGTTRPKQELYDRLFEMYPCYKTTSNKKEYPIKKCTTILNEDTKVARDLPISKDLLDPNVSRFITDGDILVNLTNRTELVIELLMALDNILIRRNTHV